MSKNLRQGRLIGKRAIAEKLGGVSTKTVDRYVEQEVLPQPIKLTGTKMAACLWYEAEIDEIIRKSAADAVRRSRAKTRASRAVDHGDDAAA